MKKKSNSLEITIPQEITLYTDERTGTRSIALPFIFPEGESGAIMILRLRDEEWIPCKKIKSITINFL